MIWVLWMYESRDTECVRDLDLTLVKKEASWLFLGHFLTTFKLCCIIGGSWDIAEIGLSLKPKCQIKLSSSKPPTQGRIALFFFQEKWKMINCRKKCKSSRMYYYYLWFSRSGVFTLNPLKKHLFERKCRYATPKVNKISADIFSIKATWLPLLFWPFHALSSKPSF